MVWKRILNSRPTKHKKRGKAEAGALKQEILEDYLVRLSEDWNFEQCKELNLWQPGQILWVEATEVTEFVPFRKKTRLEKIHGFWEGIVKKKGG